MADDSSFQEIRRIQDEFARERAWATTPEASALGALAESAFDLAHAIEAWTRRSSERWIASGEPPLGEDTLLDLVAQLRTVQMMVNAELN